MMADPVDIEILGETEAAREQIQFEGVADLLICHP